MKSTQMPNRERGSALLIVFVLAATVAIMLYMEMPVTAFEAQREKEQLLIDRGNEYAHAVKLFVRKTGQYPPSFDALENTNRMRYLRKRFKDPFTGKDDWRLLHAGPNGTLIDSKVNPISNVTGAGNSPLGASGQSTNNTTANSTFGGSNSSSSNSGFGGFNSGAPTSNNSTASNSGFGGFNSSTSSSNSAGDVVVPSIPQRPPAVAANGAADQGGSSVPAQDTLNPFPVNPQAGASQATANNGQAAGPNGMAAPTTQNGIDPNNPLGLTRGQVAGQNPTAPQGGVVNSAPGSTGTSGFGSSGFGSTSSTSSSSSSRMGVIQSGGIAGVASKAEGHTIKTVNDQENYSLWEFYYDPTKDTMKSAAGALAQMGGSRGIGQTNSSFTSGTNSSSGFGSSGNSGFGSSNTSNGFGNSGFGNSNTNSGFGNSGFGNSNTNSGFGNSGFGSSNNRQPTTSPNSQPPQ